MSGRVIYPIYRREHLPHILEVITSGREVECETKVQAELAKRAAASLCPEKDLTFTSREEKRKAAF